MGSQKRKGLVKELYFTAKKQAFECLENQSRYKRENEP